MKRNTSMTFDEAITRIRNKKKRRKLSIAIILISAIALLFLIRDLKATIDAMKEIKEIDELMDTLKNIIVFGAGGLIGFYTILYIAIFLLPTKEERAILEHHEKKA